MPTLVGQQCISLMFLYSQCADEQPHKQLQESSHVFDCMSVVGLPRSLHNVESPVALEQLTSTVCDQRGFVCRTNSSQTLKALVADALAWHLCQTIFQGIGTISAISRVTDQSLCTELLSFGGRPYESWARDCTSLSDNLARQTDKESLWWFDCCAQIHLSSSI